MAVLGDPDSTRSGVFGFGTMIPLGVGNEMLWSEAGSHGKGNIILVRIISLTFN